MKTLFILLPSLNNDSPIKGAVALANKISITHKVVVVSLASIKKDNKKKLNSNIEIISLGNYIWPRKLFKYKKILVENKTRNISLSFCFSADFINSFCSEISNTFSSLRGNIYINYKHSYGLIGFFLAKFHFHRLGKIKNIISMSKSMSNQIKNETGLQSYLICNFIDENEIKKYRRNIPNEGPYNFVYTGTLTSRKRVDVIIESIFKLREKGYKVECNILGDGNLKNDLVLLSRKLKLDKTIFFHGNVSNPFHILSKADVFILPSMSEGTSRSSMEALFLGIPCILRDIDGNSELIDDNNGILFENEKDIAQMMIDWAKKSRDNKLYKSVLLKDKFRQDKSINLSIKTLDLQE